MQVKPRNLWAWGLILSVSVPTGAQQKPKPKPKTVSVAQIVQTALTERINKDRKGQPLTVTLETSAPYVQASHAKGIRGTGTIVVKKSDKSEMFAYDVLVDTQRGTPTRVSYRLMKGVVMAADDAPTDYSVEAAQTAVRSKILKTRPKARAVFVSATPVTLAPNVLQIQGNGFVLETKQRSAFHYSAIVDAGKGRVNNVRYEFTAGKPGENQKAESKK